MRRILLLNFRMMMNYYCYVIYIYIFGDLLRSYILYDSFDDRGQFALVPLTQYHVISSGNIPEEHTGNGSAIDTRHRYFLCARVCFTSVTCVRVCRTSDVRTYMLCNLYVIIVASSLYQSLLDMA